MSSGAQIIADLITKCGIESGTASDITVNYDITASQVLDACGVLQDLILFLPLSWVCVCCSSQSHRRSVALLVFCVL